MGELFSAADIRRLVKEEGCQYLLLGPYDRITPEALDVARDLGMQVHRDGDISGGRSLPPLLNKQPRSGRPITLVKASTIQLEPFAFDVGRPNMNIHLKDVIGPDDHDIMLQLNLLPCQVRETELAAANVFISPDGQPVRPELMRALNRLSSAVYYLILLFKAGKIVWKLPGRPEQRP